MGAAASMSGDKSDTASSVKVVGLLAMGLTLMLMGLGLLPPPYVNGFLGNWAVAPTASGFGGVVLVLLGLIGLWKGHVYWGSVFTSYGAFFSAWVGTYLFYSGGLAGLLSGGSGGPTPAVFAYGLAGFTFVFLLLTLTFLVSSLKHGWLTFFLFLFLFISFVLWLVENWMFGAGNTVSHGQMWATGGITILTGLIGWYMATAHLTNWSYGRKFLPG